jgi:succinyl-CoA:acetate CoA-transferase
MSRISCPVLAAKVVAAEEAVAHIHDGDNVGFSGFTGAGYPKARSGTIPRHVLCRPTSW